MTRAFPRGVGLVLIGLVVLWAHLAVGASGPSWMPGFPMRMGPNVMLMWTPVPGATSYNVYRTDAKDRPGQKVATASMNNYMDANVPLDKDALFTVRAVMGDGTESDASPVAVLAGTKPLDPPKWTGEMIQGNQLHLRWDLVQGAAFYNLFKSESKDGPFTLKGSVQETKYVDTAVEIGKTYYYQLSSVDKNNVESPKSIVKEVTLQEEKKAAKRDVFQKLDIVTPYVRQWYGGEREQFIGPHAMSLSPVDGRVYCASDGGLVAFDADSGDLLFKFKPPPGYQGEWGVPLDLDVAPDGNIWATWQNSSSNVRKLSPDGTVLGEFNVVVPRESYLEEGREADLKRDETVVPIPLGLGVDAQGRVWIDDANFTQISVYDDAFKVIKRIGQPRPKVIGPETIKTVIELRYHKQTGRMYALDSTAKVVRIFDTKTLDYLPGDDRKPDYGRDLSGSGPGYVQIPNGMAFTRDGDVILTDGASNEIEVFDARTMKYKGSLVSEAGVPRSKQIGVAYGVLVVGDKLLVSDRLNHRVTVMSLP